MTTDRRPLGVPDDAMRRLAEMRPGQPTSLFTSDLSVNEFLLVREAGFRPLGLVLGSSIYHVGIQMGRWSKNQELDMLSQAMYHARELAMTRMEAEADALGADGIVGVRLEIEFKEFGSDLAEFIADRHRGQGRRARTPTPDGSAGATTSNQPFTSDLSGQDFWTLIQAGYAPLGMVDGHLRLPHRAPAVLAGDRQHRAERRDPAVHRGPVRRPRAGDEPDAGRGRAAARRGHRRRAAALARRTAGAGTPPSSSRSARPCARCAPTT